MLLIGLITVIDKDIFEVELRCKLNFLLIVLSTACVKLVTPVPFFRNILWKVY